MFNARQPLLLCFVTLPGALLPWLLLIQSMAFPRDVQILHASLGFRWAVYDTYDQLLASRAMSNIYSLTPNISASNWGSQSASSVVLVEYLVSSLRVSSLSSIMTLFNICSALCLPLFRHIRNRPLAKSISTRHMKLSAFELKLCRLHGIYIQPWETSRGRAWRRKGFRFRRIPLFLQQQMVKVFIFQVSNHTLKRV